MKLRQKTRSALLAALLLVPAAAFSQTLRIDFRLNTREADTKNYLSWTADGSRTKDTLDSLTGASRKHSTAALKALMSGKDKNDRLAPKGLYSLLLFPVSAFSAIKADSLSVQSISSRKLSITFIHRGYAYRIDTDDNGRIDTESSFFISGKIAENQKGRFTLLPEYADGQEEGKADFSKVSFSPDTAGSSGKAYKGALKASYDGKTLRIKGTLRLKEQAQNDKESGRKDSGTQKEDAPPPSNP